MGAKMALAILSAMSAGDFQRCVEYEDATTLTKIPGVGKKTAERLMLELKDRLSGIIRTEDAAVAANPRGDALRALLALGYSEKEANAALSKVPTELTVSEAIRQALKQLSKSS